MVLALDKVTASGATPECLGRACQVVCPRCGEQGWQHRWAIVENMPPRMAYLMELLG